VTDEQIEAACRAWWNAERDGKRIATIPWDEFVERSRRENAPANYARAVNEYRLRMRAALETLQ